MIEPLKTEPIFADRGIIGVSEPSPREIWQKVNEIIEHVNAIEGAVASLIDPKEEE